MSDAKTYDQLLCLICDKPLSLAADCATHVDLGTCHADCLPVEVLTDTPAPADGVERPKSVQAAFEVFQGRPGTGPHAAAMFRYIKELEARVSPPAPSVMGWRTMATAPLNRTPVIIAVPTEHRDDWIVGEAYHDPEHYEGGDWWWAGTRHDGYDAGPISDCNHHAPEYWQPMPPIPPTNSALSASAQRVETP